MNVRATGVVAACGGLGGATNALLCYAEIPTAVKDSPEFHWHVIPAGAIHGAVLAALAFGVALLLSSQTVPRRLAAGVPVAWLAGFASWIPLNRSAFDEPWPKSLTWTFHDGLASSLLAPLQYFGFVALLYYAAVTFWLATEHRLGPHVALAVAAGTLGSLWWWIVFEPWYFSPLHGAIWGTFVGLGAWQTCRAESTFATSA
jgi:hypothetical protein